MDINSGSWMDMFVGERKIHQLFPKWKPKKEWDVESLQINPQHYSEFQLKENTHVASLVLCRSSHWLPPHYDPLFFKLATALKEICYTNFIEKMHDRMELIHDKIS